MALRYRIVDIVLRPEELHRLGSIVQQRRLRGERKSALISDLLH